MDARVLTQVPDAGDTIAVRAADAELVGDDFDEALATFLKARRRLLAIARRFLAGPSEAEDLVQETWIRWQKMDRSVVTDPQALLATMTTRLAINVSQSARRRHETSMTPSVSERTAAGDDPAATAEQREAVEQAVLVVLESLTPRERAAFVLREAFDYPYAQISEFLHLGAANTRQLVSRARKRITAGKGTGASSPSHQGFLQAFLDAAGSGDLSDFEEFLAADLAA